MTLQEIHQSKMNKLAQQMKQYSQHPSSKKLRFFHGSTNSTREQNIKDYYSIDISNLGDVLEVNTTEKYALVEPNVSMDKLVQATLAYGLIPPVVMEFPGITVGGAINGATIEASSYKYGQFNDNCLAYELLLGNGDIVWATEKENKDLFYGISGSYGTLGLITAVKVKLIPSAPLIRTVFSCTTSYQDTVDTLAQDIKESTADFLDAILFSKDSGVVIKGYFHHRKDKRVQRFSKASNRWFYEEVKKVSKRGKDKELLIPIYDFLFRYNRGAFWMGEYTFSYLHLPSNRITKTLLNPFMNTRKLYDGLHALNISQNYFIQDFYCPIEKTLEFLKKSENDLSIFPLWLCPIKPTKTLQKLSPSFIPTSMLIDIGIWGQSKKYISNTVGLNKKFETYAKELSARKMLYAHTYYSEDEFWNIYDKKWYEILRKKYHAERIFPSVWEKTHVENKKYKVHFWPGVMKLIKESYKGKNLNA